MRQALAVLSQCALHSHSETHFFVAPPLARRFQSVALVSRRFHSLTCSPEVLRDLHICIGSRQPATRQLELVRSWLLKHTNSLRSVTIHMSSHKGDLIPLLDSCVAAATSGGMLQSLDLIQVRGGFDDSWPPYTLGRWAQSTGASSLRRLAIWHGSVLTIHCSLEGLSQLECLDLGGHALTLSSAARLPPSLTRLELAYDRSYGDVADIQSLQVKIVGMQTAGAGL